MDDWKNLLDKVVKKAADEGLLGDKDKIGMEMLPSTKKASMDPSAIANVLKSVVGEIGQTPNSSQDDNIVNATILEISQDKSNLSRTEIISKADMIIQEQLDYLESWTNINLAEARKDW